MNVGCMITNGGPHPPEKWAAVTAGQIIDIGASGPEALLSEARAFQAKLEQILTDHHGLAQEFERGALTEEGPLRLAAELDTSDHVEGALADVLGAARSTSFADHFAKPEVQAYLARLLHEHIHHIMHIERSWHADANPDHPHAMAFQSVRDNGHQALMASDEELDAVGGNEIVLAMVRNAVPGAPKMGG